MNYEEGNYLDLLKAIITAGNKRDDRTGVGTLSIFGTQLRFSLEGNKVPMLTTKKMFAMGVIEELLFFLRGETDTKILEAKGINIWKGNTSREFLDKVGMKDYPAGNMGKMYGYQWRQWQDDQGFGIDQIANIIRLLKNDPMSRRIVVSAWNVSDLPEMCLAPCHPWFQFYVDAGKLSCQFVMRSVDFFLGAAFNILSYAILTRIIAQTVGLQPGELIFVGGDTHVYTNHIKQAKEQIAREPYPFPTMTINKHLTSIEDIENLRFEDFEFHGYTSHPAIKAEMAV